jgi:hypothetical protein
MYLDAGITVCCVTVHVSVNDAALCFATAVYIYMVYYVLVISPWHLSKSLGAKLTSLCETGGLEACESLQKF